MSPEVHIDRTAGFDRIGVSFGDLDVVLSTDEAATLAFALHGAIAKCAPVVNPVEHEGTR